MQRFGASVTGIALASLRWRSDHTRRRLFRLEVRESAMQTITTHYINGTFRIVGDFYRVFFGVVGDDRKYGTEYSQDAS